MPVCFALALLLLLPVHVLSHSNDDDAVTKEWIAKVQALPPNEQARAVSDKLRKLNAPVVGTQEKVTDAGVIELTISNMGYVEDITPLAALTALEKLDMNSGKVKDISALQGLKKLKSLHIGGNPVASLAPLRGLPLEELFCNSCNVPAKKAGQWLAPVATLTKLRTLNCANKDVQVSYITGLKLEVCYIDGCRLPKDSGLAVVRNMPLKTLSCTACNVFDLRPLAGKKDLKYLNLAQNEALFDISPLRTDTGLETLTLTSTSVTDLSPLKGHKALRKLDCSHCKVFDVTPLKGLKLTSVNFFECPLADIAALEGMPLTSAVLAKTNVFNLKPLKDCPLTYLDLVGSMYVEDLSSLAGMKTLTSIYVNGTKVRNLAPLKNLPLTTLGIDDLPAIDLAPLQALKLENLSMQGAKINDLAPLKGWPLQQIFCDEPVKGELRDILKAKKTLQMINNRPKEEKLK